MFRIYGRHKNYIGLTDDDSSLTVTGLEFCSRARDPKFGFRCDCECLLMTTVKFIIISFGAKLLT